MTRLIDAAFDRSKVALLALAVFAFLGISAFANLPREADPDIPFPFVLVVLPLPGVSPEDAERLLIRPAESELRSLEGLKQIDALAFEGAAQLTLEFETTVDMDIVVTDVREAIDRAKAEFPIDAKEPVIEEINAQTLLPVVSVILYGQAPERTMLREARRLEDRLLAVPGVLDVDMVGTRDEVLEVAIRPEVMEAYGLSTGEIANAIQTNNALIPAGSLRFEDGAFAAKIPGLIRSEEEARQIPLRGDGTSVITLGDVAEVRRTFEDHRGHAIFNGRPAIGLNVTKRSGANIIEVTEGVKAATRDMAVGWPSAVKYEFIGDQSTYVYDILSGLTSSILLAILLVMITLVAALGFRSAIMVGIAIPSSFLIGLMLVALNGYTLNMMVMFAMVLSVGMLVDGAIVIVEYADRRMSEGVDRRQAYKDSAKRMFWPIVASTATTLAAFVPFLFWNDISGEFMKYLPLTLIFVLSGSLLVALIFLPLIGSFMGLPDWWKHLTKAKGRTEGESRVEMDNVDPRTLGGAVGLYARFIDGALRRPLLVLAATAFLIFVCIAEFTRASPKVDFFLDADVEQLQTFVLGRGNISAEETLEIAREVEARLADHPAIEHLYTRTGPALSRERDAPPETIALITADLLPFDERDHSLEVLEDFRAAVKGVPGVVIEVRQPPQGPEQGKDVQVELASADIERTREAAKAVHRFMAESRTDIAGITVPTFMDIEDTLPLPGVEWTLTPNRAEAGRYGVSLAQIGSAIQLVTDGLIVATYRPDDSDEELDIRLRFPEDARSIEALEQLTLQTPSGPLPISNFVTVEPKTQVDRVNRRDGQRIMDVKANGYSLIEGAEISQDLAIAATREWLEAGGLDDAIGPGVTWRIRGAAEDRDAASAFFRMAMIASMAMIGVILLLQFNSFYHAALTLSAVILSVFGVLLGIALSGQSISVIMTGTGIVALAGIVVNNNIVLIDTFHALRRTGLSVIEATVRTAAQRARPVLLTTITTIMGLLPMVFQLNVDFVAGTISIGSAVSSWWVLLSSAIVYGLAFATMLTLILTPVLLAAPVTMRDNAVATAHWVTIKVPFLRKRFAKYFPADKEPSRDEAASDLPPDEYDVYRPAAE